MSALLSWVDDYKWWLAGLSALTFVGTLVAMPLLVIRMPSDYFLRRHAQPADARRLRRIARVLVLVAKNALGLVLLVAGFVLSLPLVPGQGILTLLVALTLLNFPGKRGLELRIARQRPVLRAINWMRARAHRPPLRLPGRD